jgi:adhesin/invasin
VTPRLLALGLVLPLVLLAVFALEGATPAAIGDTTDLVLLVDSLSYVDGDNNPGDGLCKTDGQYTSYGRCTLRAAIEEANYWGGSRRVTIGVAPSVYPASSNQPASEGVITVASNVVPSRWMLGTATSGRNWDVGAYFHITAPMTIDLDNRVGLKSGSETENLATGFFVAASIVLDGGPTNVTDRVLKGLTMSNIHFDERSFYNGWPNSGSGNGIITRQVDLQHMTVVNTIFDGFAYVPFSLRNASDMSDVEIAGNTWTYNGADVIAFPNSGGFTGPVRIHHNAFEGLDNSGHDTAINFTGAGVGTSSHLIIEDNYFNYFQAATILSRYTGAVTIRRNTFGAQTDTFPMGTDNALSEETELGLHQANNGVMVGNEVGSNQANGKIRTWHPKPDGASPSVVYDPDSCNASLIVEQTPDVAGRQLESPVLIDVYWTADHRAEAYVGSGRIESGTQGVIQGLRIPRIGGNIRVQTHKEEPGFTQLRSSQYSRLYALPQAPSDRICGPLVTVNQGLTQADPTSYREIAFQVETSGAVAGPPAASAFSTAGSTAPGVLVTRVIQVSETRFTAIATADGTGEVVLSLPAGAMTAKALSGYVGPPTEASTSDDNSVTYVSPLTRVPDALEIEEDGVSGSITVAKLIGSSGDINVAVQVTDPYATVSPQPLTVLSAMPQGSAVISAGDDGVYGVNRTAVVSYTVTSTDPNFDGLLLPATDLLIVDIHPLPEVSLDKRAWVDVDVTWLDATPTFSMAEFAAHATEVHTGRSLIVGTAVWWTYEVTNPAVVPLDDIVVTDSPEGHICDIATLDPGATRICVKAGTIGPRPVTPGR